MPLKTALPCKTRMQAPIQRGYAALEWVLISNITGLSQGSVLLVRRDTKNMLLSRKHQTAGK